MRFAETLARIGIAALAAWILLFRSSTALSAGPEIFLQEEPESYLIIDKLQGLGLLPALMTSDRGLEAKEVSREAGNAAEIGDPFVEGMVRFLRLGGEPDWDYRLRLGLEYSREGRIPPNSQGLPVLKDGGLRTGGFFRWAPAEWLGVQGRGDLLAGAEGDQIGRLEETSVRLGWPQATLEAGRFSLWWGPGRHGALLFTTNAQPLTGVRIRNPRPILLGSWFRFLGLFQYDLFAARLEADRPTPNPILAGMRLAIKPNPWFEFGVSRVMHFGGEGRDESLSTFFDILTGRRESEGETPLGNSLTSADVKVLLPFRAQPFVLYGEAGAEDQSRPGVPSRWAFMGGVFLPSIGPFRKADLRAEYGTTITNSPGVWYRHSAPSGGYPHQYRGQILGHHMGTDARDFFLEAHYFLLSSSYLELNADLTQRFWPGPAREDSRRFSAAFIGWLTPFLRGEGRVAHERISDAGGISGNDSQDTSIQATLAYQYR
jgi:hypothetical protein